MKLERKYPMVNWVDGMKITQAHFKSLEDSLLESIHLANTIQLSDHDFGLLPAHLMEMDSFGVEISSERIEIYKCLAITRDGVLIQIDTGEMAGLQRSIQELLHGQNLGAATAWYVLLRVNAFERQVFGTPDTEEIPLRHPYSVPSYSIELVSEHILSESRFLKASIPLARIVISNEKGNSIDQSYIPPARNLKSISLLYSKYKDFEQILNEIDTSLIEIIKTAQYKASQNKNTNTSDDLYVMATHLSQYIADQMDVYIHILGDKSPFYLQLWFVKMARKMESSFRYLKNKDSTFNYCEQFSTYKASFFEAGVKQILNVSYNHLNVSPSLDVINNWLHSLRDMLKTLAGLSYNDFGAGGIISSAQPLPDKDSGHTGQFTISEKGGQKKTPPKKDGWGFN